MERVSLPDIFLSSLTAVLFSFSFLVPKAGFLAWLLFIPFLYAIEKKSAGDSLKLGVLTGTIANFIGAYWLIGTLNRFGGFPTAVSIVFLLVLSIYSGFLIGLFAFITNKLGLLRKGGLITALLLASVWASLENFYPLLFPYAISNTQVTYLTLIQIFDLFGIYSLSFIILFVNVTLFRIFKSY